MQLLDMRFKKISFPQTILSSKFHFNKFPLVNTTKRKSFPHLVIASVLFPRKVLTIITDWTNRPNFGGSYKTSTAHTPTDLSEQSNLLNKHYASIFRLPQLHRQENRQYSTQAATTYIWPIQPFHPKCDQTINKTNQNNDLRGLDGIRYRHLKHIGQVVIRASRHNFVFFSVRLNTILNVWKLGKIVPMCFSWIKVPSNLFSIKPKTIGIWR